MTLDIINIIFVFKEEHSLIASGIIRETVIIIVRIPRFMNSHIIIAPIVDESIVRLVVHVCAATDGHRTNTPRKGQTRPCTQHPD